MTILDTNVVSEIMRPVPAAVVLRWISNQISEDLHVTAITMAEILYGIELLPRGKRQEILRAGAERLFPVVFADRILTFDARAARELFLIASSRRKQGRPMSEFDAQIAAIARAHRTALATRDTDDFEGCGLQLINPWKASS
jgi:predicted nucleic acid-binding protein